MDLLRVLVFFLVNHNINMHLDQGWKLQTVCLSGTGKNRAGQVKILDTFAKERLKSLRLLSACLSRTGKSSARQLDLFGTFLKEKPKYFVISTPVDDCPFYPSPN